jgi:hypothetical protein
LWKNFTLQPDSRRKSTTSRSMFLEPCASSRMRTVTPARARSIRAATRRSASLPGFHRKVSKWIDFCAARMRRSSTFQYSPFSTSSTLLPGTGVPSVRPDSEGSSSSMPWSHSSVSLGLRCRRIDQITSSSTAITASATQPHKPIVISVLFRG